MELDTETTTGEPTVTGPRTTVAPPRADRRDPGPAPVSLPDDLRFPGSGGAAEYERYFRIRRSAPELAEWTNGLLTAQESVLADLPTTRLGDGERLDLLAGMLVLSQAALAAWNGAADAAGPETAAGSATVTPSATPSPLAAASAPPSPPPVPATGPQRRDQIAAEIDPPVEEPGDRAADCTTPAPALLRWRLGHQLFHLHLTLMNRLLDAAVSAAHDADWPRLLPALERLTVLYDSATAAMTYSSDFDRAVYREQVRPTMEPPFVSPGFSGVFNREHREMTALLRRLRRATRAVEPGGVPGEVRIAESRLRAAQARNRANHERICDSCVPDGGSLLRRHLEQG
ncbi:hypothetical protein [Streptomyces sp. SM14]|uniref:hypothetical protein n=1 Tax=Streptomyces sp. SM14 TaxID=1736045 RepID=UPI000CD585B5|nr:hypothetical protein [Streptomyces sp. SM14]